MSVSLLVMLLAGSLGYADNSGEDAARVLAVFGTVISSLMVVILAGMVMLGLCALCYRSALGSSKELRIMNLGKVPEENDSDKSCAWVFPCSPYPIQFRDVPVGCLFQAFACESMSMHRSTFDIGWS